MITTSEPLFDTIEILDTKPLSELVSEAVVKVCYVSELPNKNGTIINKAAGRDIAQYLPGSPIVGHFIADKNDFGGHDAIATLADGHLTYKDLTVPYGFVSLDKPWYQDFLENGIKRTYLMCKAYLWTRQYKEANQIIGKGQSIELNEQDLNGYYQGDSFVFTHAIIDRLCILGESTAPCFEGAGFETNYSLRYNNFIDELEMILGRSYKVVKGKLVNKEQLRYEEAGGEASTEAMPNNNSTASDTDTGETSAVDSTQEATNAAEGISEVISAETTIETEEGKEAKEPKEEEKSLNNPEIEKMIASNEKLEKEIEGYLTKIAELEAQVKKFRQVEKENDNLKKIEIFNSYEGLLSSEEIDSIRKTSSKLTSKEVDSQLALALAADFKKSRKKATEEARQSERVQLNVNSIKTGMNSNLPDFMKKAMEVDKNNSYMI